MSENTRGQDARPGEPESPSDRWAPWWVYLLVLLGANYGRVALMGDDFSTIVTVLIAVVQAGLLFVAITAVWRLSRRPSG